MPYCGACNSFILGGGKSEGGKRYCNAKCLEVGRTINYVGDIPDDIISKRAWQMRDAACARCGGPGPLDFHGGQQVISVIILTWTTDATVFGCHRCGKNAAIKATVTTLFAGWWGFPWGLIMTPIVLVTNTVALLQSTPPGPSARLLDAAKMDMAAQLRQRVESDAEEEAYMGVEATASSPTVRAFAAAPNSGHPLARPMPALVTVAPASPSSLAITSLVFGVLSIFAFCLMGLSLVTSIVAVVTGHMAMNRIKNSGGRLTGDGLALTGLIIGYVMLLLSAIWVTVLVISFMQPARRMPAFPQPEMPEMLEKMGKMGKMEKMEPELPSRDALQPPRPSVLPVESTSPPANFGNVPVVPPNQFSPNQFPPGYMPPGYAPPSYTPPPFQPNPFQPMPELPPTDSLRRPAINPFEPTNRTPPSPDPSSRRPTSRPESRATNRNDEGLDADVVYSFADMGWSVKSLAFSPDKRFLVAGKMDAKLLIFDLVNGKQIVEIDDLRDDLGQVTAVAFSPDGKRVIAAGYKGTIATWQMDESGQLTDRQFIAGHSDEVQSLSISPTSTYMMSGSSRGQLVWQPVAQNGTVSFRKLNAFPKSVMAIHLPSKGLEALATDGQSVVTVDLKNATEIHRTEMRRGRPQAVAFSPDGGRVAITSGYAIDVFDTATRANVMKIDTDHEIQWSIGFMPDGKRIYSGGRGQVTLWDAISGEPIKRLNVGGNLYIKAIAISDDMQWLATIPDSAGQTLRVIRIPQ
ncbi:WD domain, G-beta repeat [Rubripirellula tenax]|uniref:WD domain, G-beta repeat n=1 Tax=Rubripirellula tenax TaxID=2528015 RepID=A0A5C6FI15_9BACT|nr:DUF4190 domain-containing protein [Rubripirellula tenax]TWU59281.1 WD domain, G-beta repeat [Rubripirellula tenax]